MNDKQRIVQTGQDWFVETPDGRIGPMDSQGEAQKYLSLMRAEVAAGRETACTEKECFS